jgi:hypothetical protein
MANKGKDNIAPRINNRRALHDYFIDAKIECGVALVGSEVKSLRAGKAQLQDAFAKIIRGELFLVGAHIDPYEKAGHRTYNHEPRRGPKAPSPQARAEEARRRDGRTRAGDPHPAGRSTSSTAGRRSRSAWPAASSSTTSGRRSRSGRWTRNSAARR